MGDEPPAGAGSEPPSPPARPSLEGPTFGSPGPARPDVAGAAFAPSAVAPPAPPIVSTALSVWVASLAAGLLAAGSAVRSRLTLRDRFEAQILEADPDAAAQTVADAADLTVVVVVGGMVLVWLVHVVLVVATARGRGLARWLLVVTGLLGALVLVALQEVVGSPEQGVLEDLQRLALLAQAALAVVGSLLLLAPGAHRWFRARRRAR